MPRVLGPELPVWGLPSQFKPAFCAPFLLIKVFLNHMCTQTPDLPSEAEG